MHEDNRSKKPLIVYYIIALVVVMLLNALLFPQIERISVKEVEYSEFLEMLANDEIDTVQINDTQIAFEPKEQIQDGKATIYTTNRVTADDKIVERLLDAGVTFGQVVPEQMSPIIEFLLSWVLPLVIFYALGSFMFRKMSQRMGGNSMSFGKSNAKIYVEAQTGKTFDDVAGEDEAKDALKEIVDFLHDPQKYRDIGAKLPKGALLVGPPGTGKTLLAKAVAGEAKVPFFSISGSEFVEMFVGMGAARVRDLFKQAGEKAPCIVFIDEIDAIGKRRDNAGMGGNDEREQTLNQLLTEMDGFDAGKGVVILAATNRPEILDKALLRPGRFDRRIPVELPDLAGREAILRVHAKEVKTDPGIDYTQIARATSGCSGAELANVINEAAIAAVKDGRKTVSQRDLEEAIEIVIAGYQRKNAVVSQRDKLTVSYHEIGHALVAAKLENAAPVQKITIIPRTSGALGYTMQVDEEERLLMTKEQILDKITTFCGGRAAEALIFGRITSGASNDIEQATKLARMMITRLGMSDTFGMMALETQSGQYLSGDANLVCSEQTAARIDVEVKQIIAQCYERAMRILTDNKGKLHEAAKVLLEKETITGIEFMAILAPNQLPSSTDDTQAQEDGAAESED
ncbi:MAG: ATP-dependent zinc metalloprotease FtsH [Clostridiales bacterium]|nr:ATP-dependent zinc metalloprotease FtsH [Clostridiales bacterium]MDY5349968.1 ATP-dependent zinc metalloprotease FtsH [Candidatus Ventricola sp.]MDY5515838.1 ATP-dependent zinc metalloprotease FtsH [Candidatus Ventricola sp.]